MSFSTCNGLYARISCNFGRLSCYLTISTVDYSADGKYPNNFIHYLSFNDQITGFLKMGSSIDTNGKVRLNSMTCEMQPTLFISIELTASSCTSCLPCNKYPNSSNSLSTPTPTVVPSPYFEYTLTLNTMFSYIIKLHIRL